mmetsp:Transcript_15110/g.38990  ORF Transcript_15110/g.38990 Transcript_15110/m.38990 type:complete len:435 (+) Transcript_15110:105-1409(+)
MGLSLVALLLLPALTLFEYACSPHFRSTILPVIVRHGTLYDVLAIIKYVLLLTPQRCVRLLGKLLACQAPACQRQPQTVFIIGLPRSATSHIHDCLIRACDGKASACVFLDNLFPTQSLQRVLRPLVRLVSHSLAGRYSSNHHHLETDEWDEEDQVLLHRWHNLWIHAFLSKHVNGVIAHSKTISIMDYDDDDLPWIDECIRAICARDGTSLFIGKPVATSPEYARYARHFSDSKFVVCWRHPLAQLVSMYSLFETLEFFEPHTTDQIIIREHMATRYELILELKAKHANDPRFEFMPFEQWVASPAACARRVCEAFGLPCASNAEDLMRVNREKKGSDAAAALRREKAIEIIRMDWDTRWKPIFEELGFDAREVWRATPTSHLEDNAAAARHRAQRGVCHEWGSAFRTVALLVLFAAASIQGLGAISLATLEL